MAKALSSVLHIASGHHHSETQDADHHHKKGEQDQKQQANSHDDGHDCVDGFCEDCSQCAHCGTCSSCSGCQSLFLNNTKNFHASYAFSRLPPASDISVIYYLIDHVPD